MKRVFGILLLILLTANLGFAQFKIGPKVGFNLGRLTENMDSVKSMIRGGFQIGAFVRIGNKIYLQPEIYYATQGGIFQGDKKLQWKQTVKLSSIDVPVLVGFKFIDMKLVNLRVMLGPVASVLVNKKITLGVNSVAEPLKTSNINDLNWAFQVGAGVDISKLTFDLRYQVGLNDMIKNVNGYKFSTRNDVWVFSLGFKI